ncbi:hypothetical protein RI129_002925 [Pyrocoelia pectoralis]|uniref:Regulatory protein zeste n=1 Tax=Pyrocoelia pectoralis TaxID=417401 RepID=A0AAN7VP20_9COLE
MTSLKKERSSNFSESEIRLLVDVVIKHSKIIECAKSDSVTWKEKNNAWTQLITEFNSATSALIPRTTKSLKTKYEGLKKELRKKKAIEKQELFKTGGGEPVKTTFTDWEEKLLILISITCEGLAPINDCDSAVAERYLPTLQNHNLLIYYFILTGTKISSINELAEAKIALSKMQLQLTEAEMQFKTEEHQLRINALQNEYVLKQKCLEMDLEIKIKQRDVQAAILEGLELDNDKKRLELQKV